MTSISKNVYIDKLDDRVSEYNNKYHKTIKMKPVDVKNNTYITKFQVGDHVRIWKCKNIFAKWHSPNWSEEIFVIKKVKNSVLKDEDLKDEEIIGTFYEKELKKNKPKRI